MADALDVLRAASRRDVTLDSGIVVTVRRVSMVDAVILAGDAVPSPVLSALAEEDRGDEPEATSEDEMLATIRAARERQKAIVRECVVAVNGEAVSIPEDEDLAGLFTDAEVRLLSDTALWVDAEGKG